MSKISMVYPIFLFLGFFSIRYFFSKIFGFLFEVISFLDVLIFRIYRFFEYIILYHFILFLRYPMDVFDSPEFIAAHQAQGGSPFRSLNKPICCRHFASGYLPSHLFLALMKTTTILTLMLSTLTTFLSKWSMSLFVPYFSICFFI